MNRRIALVLATLWSPLATATWAEHGVDFSYDAMTRPTQPLSFMVWLNGQPTPLGVMPLVQGLEDGLPVGGTGGTSITAPVDPSMPDRVNLQVRWVDADDKQGWHADVPLFLSSFPKDAEPKNDLIAALNARIERDFGPSDRRSYRLALRFEPGGVLSVWTPSTELLAGEQGRLADWRDYVQLAAVCASPDDGLIGNPAFIAAEDWLRYQQSRSSATIGPDGSVPMTCAKGATVPSARVDP